jgi:hypothetical protein
MLVRMKDSVLTNYKGDIFSSRKPDIPSHGSLATTAMQKLSHIPLISRNEYAQVYYLKIQFSLLEQR